MQSKLNNLINKMNFERILLILLLLLSTANMIYQGSRKEGYHVDEVYSYGLANSEYLPFMHFGEMEYSVKDWMKSYGPGENIGDLFKNLINDFKLLKECDFRFKESVIYRDYLIAQTNSYDTKTTTWMSGQAYQDYISASKNNRFNIASVYYNQRGDVHPPLFYLLLHFLCSIFYGTFSKWFGLSLNILYMLLALILIWKITSRYLGSQIVGYMSIIAYGFSLGFIDTAVFIRMYALFTLLALFFFYMNLKLADGEFTFNRKLRVELILATLLGYMTHYYFVLYAIGVAVVMCIWMACTQKWKSLLSYILTLMGSAVIGIIIWPFSIKHVFFGYRNAGALQALDEKRFYFDKFRWMFEYVFQGIFGGHAWVFPVILLLIVAGLGIARAKKVPLGIISLITIPVLFYTMAVSQIVPYLDGRYVMCSYPFIVMICISGIYYTVRRFCNRYNILPKKLPEYSVIFLGIMFLLTSNSFARTSNYLYIGGQETIEIPEHTVCIYVMADGSWNVSARETTALAKCDKVAVTYLSTIEVLNNTYEYKDGETVLVMIHDGLDVESSLEKVCDVFDLSTLNEVNRVITRDNSMIYLEN